MALLVEIPGLPSCSFRFSSQEPNKFLCLRKKSSKHWVSITHRLQKNAQLPMRVWNWNPPIIQSEPCRKSICSLLDHYIRTKISLWYSRRYKLPLSLLLVGSRSVFSQQVPWSSERSVRRTGFFLAEPRDGAPLSLPAGDGARSTLSVSEGFWSDGDRSDGGWHASRQLEHSSVSRDLWDAAVFCQPPNQKTSSQLSKSTLQTRQTNRIRHSTGKNTRGNKWAHKRWLHIKLFSLLHENPDTAQPKDRLGLATD